MVVISPRALAAVALLSMSAMPSARAQWAVVDAPAIVQLIQEVQTMEQQLQTTRDQLAQAKQALQTMTGGRGMQRLLGGTPRNYLPSNGSQLTAAMQGVDGGYPALASDVRSALGNIAVLSPAQLSTLSTADQQRVLAGRRASALQQAVAQEALVNVSGRFASIQTLVDAISTATDQKAILDLQARIVAELGMLQNEQTKLQILRQVSQAQESANQQQEREQLIAEHGNFATRFRPTP
jgi:type IV secretion system protein VirB5